MKNIMLLNRVPIIGMVIIFVGMLYTLFYIKNHVITVSTKILEVKQKILCETETIHILQAELSYLTSPNRLKILNKNYLKLQNTKMEQIISNPRKKTVLSKNHRLTKTSENNIKKWCYKKAPSKYLTTISKTHDM